MKKVLVSLVAVVGLLVAGENTVKEVKICEGKGAFVKADETTVFPNMRLMHCYSAENKIQKLSNESFQNLYESGWRYVGTFSGTMEFENKVHLPGSDIKDTSYLIFERVK